MSYVCPSDSFWEYALVILQDIMNLVTSKVVSTTPNELWTGRKPKTGLDLKNLAHVLKRDLNIRRKVICLPIFGTSQKSALSSL